jgi:hypothetical protein
MVSSATITTTTADVFLPEVWSTKTLDAIEFACPIQNRVNREYEGELNAHGDTLHIPRTSNLTTGTKTSGLANVIAWEAITETKQDLTVSTLQYAAFLIEDQVKTQAMVDLEAKYTQKLGYALARGREVAITTLFQSLTGLSSIGTYGVELTGEDYAGINTTFAGQGLIQGSMAPSKDFTIILSPEAYGAATKTDIFSNRDYTDAQPAKTGVIGNIYGFSVLVSNLLRVPATGQHDCAAIHRDAIILAVQKEVKVEKQRIIENLGTAVVAWNLHGSTVVSFPPETPGGDTAIINRGILLKTV